MTKKNQDLKILGIETSCDETAVAIVSIKENYKGKILSNKIFSQNKEHSPYGGVVPEIASRSHVENLDGLLDQALKDSKLSFDRYLVVLNVGKNKKTFVFFCPIRELI